MPRSETAPVPVRKRIQPAPTDARFDVCLLSRLQIVVLLSTCEPTCWPKGAEADSCSLRATITVPMSNLTSFFQEKSNGAEGD